MKASRSVGGNLRDAGQDRRAPRQARAPCTPRPAHLLRPAPLGVHKRRRHCTGPHGGPGPVTSQSPGAIVTDPAPGSPRFWHAPGGDVCPPSSRGAQVTVGQQGWERLQLPPRPMRRGRGGGWRGSRVWGRRGTRGRPDLARVRGARQSEGEKVDPAAGALAPFLPARQEAGGSWLRALPGCTTALCGPGGSKHIKRGPSGLQASPAGWREQAAGGRVAAAAA